MFKSMAKQVLAALFALTLLIGGGMMLTHVAMGSPNSQVAQTPAVSAATSNAQTLTLASNAASQEQDDALEAGEGPDNDNVQDGPQDGPDDGTEDGGAED